MCRTRTIQLTSIRPEIRAVNAEGSTNPDSHQMSTGPDHYLESAVTKGWAVIDVVVQLSESGLVVNHSSPFLLGEELMRALKGTKAF